MAGIALKTDISFMCRKKVKHDGKKMKIKRIAFQQHLSHDIDDSEQEGIDEYLYNAMPLIGLIVMRFNGLEKHLDSVLCERFTDRTDQLGLIVINKLNYASKIDLFKRLSDDILLTSGVKIVEYIKLINNLKECGRLRNIVVHADWENTDEKGYTFLNVKINQEGTIQEYIQFTLESLNKIYELIVTTAFELDDVCERINDVIYCRGEYSQRSN